MHTNSRSAVRRCPGRLFPYNFANILPLLRLFGCLLRWIVRARRTWTEYPTNHPFARDSRRISRAIVQLFNAFSALSALSYHPRPLLPVVVPHSLWSQKSDRTSDSHNESHGNLYSFDHLDGKGGQFSSSRELPAPEIHIEKLIETKTKKYVCRYTEPV